MTIYNIKCLGVVDFGEYEGKDKEDALFRLYDSFDYYPEILNIADFSFEEIEPEISYCTCSMGCFNCLDISERDFY